MNLLLAGRLNTTASFNKVLPVLNGSFSASDCEYLCGIPTFSRTNILQSLPTFKDRLRDPIDRESF